MVIQVSDTSETDVMAEMFHVTSTAFLHVVRCFMYTVLCCIVIKAVISHCLFAVLSVPTLVLNIGSIGSISICIEILLIRLSLETLAWNVGVKSNVFHFCLGLVHVPGPILHTSVRKVWFRGTIGEH